MNKTYKILYAEDEEYLAESIILGLKHSKSKPKINYEIDYVTDGLEALYKLKQNSYDLIITDNRMLKMDGITFIKKIREEGNNTPAILTTGTPADLLKKDKFLFKDIVQKPFSASQLELTIKNLLEGKNE